MPDVSQPRRPTRFDVAIDVSVRVEGRTLEGRSRNLSLGGIAIELGERLPIGTRARLTFRLPGNASPIETDAEVRWSVDRDTGLQFGGLRAREVWELGRFFDGLPPPV
jgi:hypothetical protein